MNPTDCCKGIEMELTAWKAKLNDAVRKIEQLPSGQKQKILGNVEDLEILIAEMDDRIDEVRADCLSVTEFKVVKDERDEGIPPAAVNYEDAMAGLGAGNFGG